jgi:hypothetical protein
MYGLVNKALQDMVVSAHGEETWERIKAEAGVDVEMFLTNEAYSDDITYSLAGAASKVLDAPVPELLEAFGVHWVLNTAPQGYGQLMDSGGATLSDFLKNLPAFHTRVGLIFPHLTPPVFTTSDVKPGSLRLQYRSHRPGLAPFVVGLVKGLGQRFGTPVEVTHVVARGDEADRDEFLVEWKEPAAA